MAPYNASSFDGSGSFLASPPVNCSEDVIFSLTERLREHDAEIRQLKKENAALQSQLHLHGNLSRHDIKIDVEYEELLAHLKQREEVFRMDTKKQEKRVDGLEKENCKLKKKLNTSRQLLDDQEKTMSIMENEREDGMDRMEHAALGEIREKEDQITMLHEKMTMLEDIVEEKHEQIAMLADQMSLELTSAKESEEADKELLARLGERIEEYRQDQQIIEKEKEELQTRVETQYQLLKEKDEELIQMERFRDQRQEELTEDLEAMRIRINEIVDYGQIAIGEREEEIHLLYRQCETYEDIIDEADYITYEQRADLRVKKQEIEELSRAIEIRNQHSQSNTEPGWLTHLDQMCRGDHA